MASALHFGLVVYGSTSAAVAASIQAARLGRRVALVSPHEHIGGIQVEGLGSSDIDNQPEFQNSTTLGGLNLELHERISRHYGRLDRLRAVVAQRQRDPDVWRFESSVAERVIAAWLAEHAASIRIFKSALAEADAVVKDGATVKAIRLLNGQTIGGDVFVEASYEGDFLAAAGVATTYGREARAAYNESLAGIRATTPYRQLDVPVDPYVVPGDPSSGLLYGISDEPFGTPGDGDRHLQSYSFRLPITDDPANRIPFSVRPPAGYDPAHFELHRRFLRAGGAMYRPAVKLPNRKTDLIGSEAPLATDLLGMNDDWPVASYARRRAILDEAARFTKGLLYFFSHDEAVPEDDRAAWARFGYCRDEFPDNDHFPRQLYIRDARRMVSDYIITEHTATRADAGGLPPAPDPVAVAFWPTDTHSVRRVLRDGRPHNEGFVFKDGHRWRPFGIAYRALVPRAAEAANVLSATCPSASHVGYGAVRLEHQFYALGQACANAADLALRDGVPVQAVPYADLRARLEAQGVVIDVETVGAPTFPGDS